jgi:secretion/DNA translocation related TadE-like protein
MRAGRRLAVTDESGAGTVLAAGVAAAVVVLFGVLAVVGVVLETHRRVVSVADAAALAAADTALGNATGVPCDRAAAMTVGAALRLDACDQHGTLVRVRVSTAVLGVPLASSAVAGPDPSP